ncbi:MAG: triose-phosphate isomerase [Gammaproteobacteria bacterium]|nr:triose-phosphate isomerase [Gammaproteobacteria bacterium]
MRQRFVAGNWKLNGTRQSISTLLQGILSGMQDVKNAEVAVCAPYIYIPLVAESLKNSAIVYGAQNVSEYESGAYTGEISAPMLKEFDCKYAIVGHSERRSIYNETDQQVAAKFVAAQNFGIRPILCVGERLEERESNDTENVVARQLDAVIAKAGIESFREAVIAYEPVWAIGTGKTASPEQAQEVHAFIRQRLARKNPEVANLVQILYGGSVKPDNARSLFAQADIDGGLIGGASLDASGFLSICCAAN